MKRLAAGLFSFGALVVLVGCPDPSEIEVEIASLFPSSALEGAPGQGSRRSAGRTFRV